MVQVVRLVRMVWVVSQISFSLILFVKQQRAVILLVRLLHFSVKVTQTQPLAVMVLMPASMQQTSLIQWVQVVCCFSTKLQELFTQLIAQTGNFALKPTN